MRYIDASFLEPTLWRGKSVEQFLGRSSDQDAVRWLELRPASDAFEIWEFAVPDLGNPEHLDLYGFLGPDDGKLVTTLSTPSEAFAYAHLHLGARAGRWVNQFIAQEEYRAFIEAGRPIAWPSVGG